MARQFDVPSFYRSEIIGNLKRFRTLRDLRKKDLSPTLLKCGSIELSISRHFGFCYGVENAIEIAYHAIAEHPGKNIYLLSEMIHNPEVNLDLRSRGVQFLMDPSGRVLVPLAELKSDDIVIVPAFGTSVKMQESLQQLGIDPYRYDTTCPFVKRVWKKAEELGREGFTVIIHGKRMHEETTATFSHAEQDGPCLIVRDEEDAQMLGDFILGRVSLEVISEAFDGACSDGFDFSVHLDKVGVVNQTTMLSSETERIAEIVKNAFVEKYGMTHIGEHFAETRDTLCYATNENQNATRAMIEAGASLAIVVGGYNSSNTSHLYELCAKSMPTYYIKDATEILSSREICHFDLATRNVIMTRDWLLKTDTKYPIKIAITSGASCPDRTVDRVIIRILELVEGTTPADSALTNLLNENNLGKGQVQKEGPSTDFCPSNGVEQDIPIEYCAI